MISLNTTYLGLKARVGCRELLLFRGEEKLKFANAVFVNTFY